jgi:hypothetical protein
MTALGVFGDGWSSTPLTREKQTAAGKREILHQNTSPRENPEMFRSDNKDTKLWKLRGAC